MKLSHLLAAIGAVLLGTPASAGEVIPVVVDPTTVERMINPDRLVGGNVALWYEATALESDTTARAMKQWQPGILRMPGGSWSDEYFWNGNGVRNGSEFDLRTRRKGVWDIDYSDYAPGFRLGTTDGTLSDFHGNIDVKALHEFIQKQGAATIVTVNAGTGTPEMAAEWVRWANKKQHYAVRYWEVGNELDGEWELGHFGPDGKALDAEAYARRFVTYAKAMKAIDPTIKIGGPACSNNELLFVETLIREAGSLLDFVTFHTYPVLAGNQAHADSFAQAGEVAKATARIRGWIAKHQPNRIDEIEIGVTEWHKQVMETANSVDLSSGLWACLHVGAMAKAGVDFANQWDLYSTTKHGGHGLLDPLGTSGPRATFHALTLWQNHMQGDWLGVSGDNKTLRAFATKNAEELSVMLVNTSPDTSREISLQIGNKPAQGRAQAYRFSQREYFWNPLEKAPAWSTGPRETRVDFGKQGRMTVPPFSAMVVKLPLTGTAKATAMTQDAGDAELAIILPERAPADLPVEGFVVVRRKGSTEPWQGLVKSVTIGLRGDGSLVEPKVRTDSAVGRFHLQPSGPGRATVHVSHGELSATKEIIWTPVTERKKVLWTFSEEQSLQNLETTYQLILDRQVRPNQSVAAVVLNKAVSKPDQSTLLAISQLPEKLPKDRIGGVCGHLRASADLTCDDPDASVEIILQSNHDHWIPLTRIPLSKLRGGWQDLAIRITQPERLSAMPEIYSLRFGLKTKSPVTGRVYLDDLGFILRGTPSP